MPAPITTNSAATEKNETGTPSAAGTAMPMSTPRPGASSTMRARGVR